MGSVRDSWEQRAESSGFDPSGVLFRGLSDSANASIHAWHAWLVCNVFLPTIPQGGRVLDLGCGYGRLSRLIVEQRPDIRLFGQDLALAYCKLYQHEHGACVQGDAVALPFVDGFFDGVLAVTCLMYVERESVPKVLRGLHAVLRSGGNALVLDPGLELQRLITSVRRHAVSPTGGSGFARAEYRQLITNAGFSIVASGGNPHLSRTLILAAVAGSRSKWSRALIQRGMLRDCSLSGYARMTLHRWLSVERRTALV